MIIGEGWNKNRPMNEVFCHLAQLPLNHNGTAKLHSTSLLTLPHSVCWSPTSSCPHMWIRPWYIRTPSAEVATAIFRLRSIAWRSLFLSLLLCTWLQVVPASTRGLVLMKDQDHIICKELTCNLEAPRTYTLLLSCTKRGCIGGVQSSLETLAVQGLNSMWQQVIFMVKTEQVDIINERSVTLLISPSLN